MRSFIATTALFAASVTASASGYTDCATAALDGIDASKFNDCTDLSAEDCFCNNKDAIDTLSDSAADVCKEAGIDLSSLTSSLCSSDRAAAPARHASKPMEPVDMNMKRAYSPSSDVDAEMPAPRVVYVTETRTECSCKTTPAPAKVSQIPVDVPVSSSMIGMLAASSPVYSNGILVAAPSSSVLFGSQASASVATPTPSGADPNRFSPFQGAAPQVSAARGGIAAMGVAAVMGLMIAL